MTASRFTAVASLIIWISPIKCLAQRQAVPDLTPRGRVVRAEGDQPIRHARVELVSASTDSWESRLTDDEGRFDFPALEGVTYKVIVSAAGYQKLETTARIQRENGPLLLRLRKAEDAATPIDNNVVSIQELRMDGKADRSFSKGTKLLSKGQAAQSLVYFNRAIAKDSTYYRAYHNLGLAHLRLGHMPEAQQALQRAIDLTGGGYAPSDFAMGMALCQADDYRGAERVIQKGLEIEPGSAAGKFYLAVVQFALNRLAEAEKSVEQALSRQGDLPEAYFLLAGIHLREQNSPAVEQDLTEYLQLQPNGPQSDKARSLLARTLREMNKSAAASGTVIP